LGGDIRILRQSKTEMDYRPGTPLSQVIAVFSLPATVKPDGLDAVGQASQLRISRCWKESQDRLGCITCHDPHGEEVGAGTAAYYRSRCQQCHATRPCTEDAAPRRAAAEDCVACHMPRAALNRIAHIAHTNHRIVRYKEDLLDPSLADAQGSDLIYESRGQPDSRSRALAYAEAARGLPVFSGRALRLLQAVAQTDPQDAEVACALGLAQPNPTEAQPFLERAVCAEGKSKLSNLLADRGEAALALRLGREAVDAAPYDADVVLSLAGIYLRLGDLENARTILDRVRGFDPANPTLEDLLRRSRGAR
jgi:Flp pilus assembly protein TadD